VIGLISWTIALLVAVPITWVLTRGVGLAILTAPVPAVYGISGILAWLIFSLILATIASAFPARRASQLTVRDTLVYE
jgi:putative ABC transport system permease protein